MGQSVNHLHLTKLSLEDRLTAVGKLFEDKWKLGPAPIIAEYLLMVPASERPLLLVKLYDIDSAYRQKRGEATSPAEYLEAYPFDSVVLKEYVQSLVESDPGGVQSTQTFSLHRRSVSEPEIVIPEDLTPFLTPPLPFQKLGRFQILACIGKGGFGEVYRAHDPLLTREVALKTLRPSRVADAQLDEKLLDEGKRVAGIEHPGIVRVYEAGFDQGRHFLVTELLTGGTLADCLREKRFEWREAALLVAEIAEALNCAHEHGIIHRDLKPQNILIDGQGKPRIADFGLATTEEEQLLEQTGTLGTYAYMPPETMQGGAHIADARSDIYSLGAILYHLLTERLMFVAKTRLQWRTQALERIPKAPRLIVKAIPIEIEQICLKCLHKDPVQRFALASDIAQELRAVVDADLIARQSREQIDKIKNRQRWVVAICLLLIVGGVAAWSTPRMANVDPAANRFVVDFEKFPMAAEPVIFSTPGTKWQRLLMTLPSILQWPDNKRDSTIRFDSRDFELFASCNRLGLLELGTTNQKNFDFQVNIFQNAWQGGIGIFLGYQDAPESGPGHKRLQAVSLQRIFGERRPQSEIRLINMLLDDSGVPIEMAELPCCRTDPAEDREQMLIVEIRDNKLHSIQWDGKKTFIAADTPVPKNVNFQGRFGLCLNAATGSFRSAHIRVLSPEEVK